MTTVYNAIIFCTDAPIDEIETCSFYTEERAIKYMREDIEEFLLAEMEEDNPSITGEHMAKILVDFDSVLKTIATRGFVSVFLDTRDWLLSSGPKGILYKLHKDTITETVPYHKEKNTIWNSCIKKP